MESIFLQIEELVQDLSLREHYAALSKRYRTEQNKQLASYEEHLAYLASRMPATFAACSEVFSRLDEVAAGFSPKSMLDIGSGPGTCVLAFPGSVEQVTMVEINEQFVAFAKKFLSTKAASCRWQSQIPQGEKFDLVTSSYMLSELHNLQEMLVLIEQAVGEMAVLIDTGTPHGYQTLMQARDYFIKMGYTILAPCPHNGPCPMPWCHFSVRLPRSRLHRHMKGGSLGYEDEKFCYLIASKSYKRASSYDRIVKPPLHRSGHTHLTLCTHEGILREEVVSKKTKERYKAAKKAEWGDTLSI